LHGWQSSLVTFTYYCNRNYHWLVHTCRVTCIWPLMGFPHLPHCHIAEPVGDMILMTLNKNLSDWLFIPTWQICYSSINLQDQERGCRCRDRMVVGFITTCAISAYHHLCCEFESSSGEVY
jgi:hypothetical protein